MKRKFKSGDRVRTTPNNAWVDFFFLTKGVDYVGTVIGYDDDLVLVKFDNFNNGHAGLSYYSKKGITYDLKNYQHLYALEKDLCLLEGEEHDN